MKLHGRDIERITDYVGTKDIAIVRNKAMNMLHRYRTLNLSLPDAEEMIEHLTRGMRKRGGFRPRKAATSYATSSQAVMS